MARVHFIVASQQPPRAPVLGDYGARGGCWEATRKCTPAIWRVPTPHVGGSSERSHLKLFDMTCLGPVLAPFPCHAVRWVRHGKCAKTGPGHVTSKSLRWVLSDDPPPSGVGTRQMAGMHSFVASQQPPRAPPQDAFCLKRCGN